MEQSRICVEGQNCWRAVSAQRATFLIDGASYFATFAAAVERARKSILIVGWDVDSRIQLIRDDPAPDLPTQLGALLNAVVARRRSLQVHVLGWDFAMLYALDREPCQFSPLAGAPTVVCIFDWMETIQSVRHTTKRLW